MLKVEKYDEMLFISWSFLQVDVLRHLLSFVEKNYFSTLKKKIYGKNKKIKRYLTTCINIFSKLSHKLSSMLLLNGVFSSVDKILA